MLTEYVRGMELRRRSAKRPIILFVTLLVGASSSGAKLVRSSKYLLRRSRRCNRTRHTRAFTAAWLRFSTSPVCSIESPTLRSTKTVRKIGRSSFTVLTRMSRNSDASTVVSDSAIDRGCPLGACPHATQNPRPIKLLCGCAVFATS
jgi:hypothetical protein